MGYQIIGKTTNKEDIELLANMAGTANVLPNLAVGEWIINGINLTDRLKLCKLVKSKKNPDTFMRSINQSKNTYAQ